MQGYLLGLAIAYVLPNSTEVRLELIVTNVITIVIDTVKRNPLSL